MACGASGYVIKTALLDELVPAIARALGAVRVEGEDEPKDQRRTTEQYTEGVERELERLSRDTFEDMVIQEKVKIVRSVAELGSKRDHLDAPGPKDKT
jgi:predicted RNA methylase